MNKTQQIIAFLIVLNARTIYTGNQTDDLTPVLVKQPLPFTITIKLADFEVPGGIQSSASALYNSQYLFLAGRTNGLHNFNNDNNNFPPSQQNTNIFVINPCTQTVTSRSLYDPKSGLTQQQIDSLSVTSPEFYQSGTTLYIAGGYGVDTSTGNFSTKPTLTAIDVPGLICWVTNPQSSALASQYIRQISHPVFQVTGGHMYQFGKNPTLLMLGQNFEGFYTAGSNGTYTEQIRRFHIIDNGTSLSIALEQATTPDPNYRRRDLNIVPIILTDCKKKLIPAYVALSGVFTPSVNNPGIWTVPIEITADGTPSMANPTFASTFKQGMNNYICPRIELLSKNKDMYIVLMGGITFEYYQDGQFLTDSGFPFTNQCTVIKRSKGGQYSQYLLPNQYPTLTSTASNPGNVLLFGAGGKFITAPNIPMYLNGVLDLSRIKKPTVIGYIVGGIQSTLPNTNTSSDSAASPYIFKVILTPNC